MMGDIKPGQAVFDDMARLFASAQAEIDRLQAHVNDLQSGMYINCVYCGHRYGPNDGNTPTSMADVLKAHVEVCPKHPMSALKAELTRVQPLIVAARNLTCAVLLRPSAVPEYLSTLCKAVQHHETGEGERELVILKATLKDELARLRRLEAVAKQTVQALLTDSSPEENDWQPSCLSLDTHALWKLIKVVDPDAYQRMLDHYKAMADKTFGPQNVHTRHCCEFHGCKYGDDDCPVARCLQKAEYECEICNVVQPIEE